MAEERILVVDHERAARRRLSTLLKQRGLQPSEASSGEEALRKGQEGDYAAILLDLEDPGVDAVGVVERIIALKPEQSIIVLAPPGHPLTVAALTKGAYSALAKPAHPIDVGIGLRNALERYRLFRTNTVLREETLQDDLTGVLNRRYLDRYLAEEIERSRRYKHHFSVLFFGLDHFKHINDRFGHLSGSRVLIELVAVIQAHLRRADKIFRFGGDEFSVTLPETDCTGAVDAAHRLRQAIRNHRFHPTEGAEVSLTASFGVATFPENGATGEELLRHADEAMYLVKTGTRDGVGIKEGR